MTDQKDIATTDYDEYMAREMEIITQSISKPSSKRIKTRGKMFTMPDGSSNAGPIEVIVVDYVNVNTYYEGVYDMNNPKPPSCEAINKIIDDMAPSDNVTTAQNLTCAGCPKNEWGSAPNNGKGKACKNSKRLAVIRAVETDNPTIFVIDVSPTGLTAFDSYVRRIAKEINAPISRVVTSIAFNPNEPYPTLTFNMAEENAMHDMMETVLETMDSARDILAIESDFSKS